MAVRDYVQLRDTSIGGALNNIYFRSGISEIKYLFFRVYLVLEMSNRYTLNEVYPFDIP